MIICKLMKYVEIEDADFDYMSFDNMNIGLMYRKNIELNTPNRRIKEAIFSVQEKIFGSLRIVTI